MELYLSMEVYGLSMEVVVLLRTVGVPGRNCLMYPLTSRLKNNQPPPTVYQLPEVRTNLPDSPYQPPRLVCYDWKFPRRFS